MQVLWRWISRRQLRFYWLELQQKGPLKLALSLFFTIFALHTVLFYYFEKPIQNELTWFDSCWVTFTTLTTVGYGDISAKSVGGRLTTMFFGYVAGLSLFAWLASEIINRLLEKIELRRSGMLSLSLQNHILLINFPSRSKVERLIGQLRSAPFSAQKPLVIVTDQVEQEPFPQQNIYFVRGPVTEPETYRRACIDTAQRAIILAHNPEDPNTDAITAAILLTLETMNPELKTVAECIYEKHIWLFQHVQCDGIVFTGDFAVKMLVQEAEDTGTSGVISQILDRRLGQELYSVILTERSRGNTFCRLMQACLDHGQEVLPIGLFQDGQMKINPDASTTIQPGDRLLLLSEERPQWSRLEALWFPSSSTSPTPKINKTVSDSQPENNHRRNPKVSKKKKSKKKFKKK